MTADLVDIAICRPKPGAVPLLPASGGPAHQTEQGAANGLLLPKKFDHSKLLASSRISATLELLQQPNAHTPDYARRLASGYAPWVCSIRTGAGAIACPTPEQAVAVECVTTITHQHEDRIRSYELLAKEWFTR